MVGQQPITLQWLIDYTNTGQGTVCQGIRTGESVVQEGTGSTFKSTETFSHKICYLDICQNVENVSYTFPGR